MVKVILCTYVICPLVAIPKPHINQSAERPNTGSSYNLTCIFSLPTGVEANLLRINWSNHMSLNDSQRVSMSKLLNVTESQYVKIVTFQEIRAIDKGNYTCTVYIDGFTDSFDVIEVNGKCTSSCNS